MNQISIMDDNSLELVNGGISITTGVTIGVVSLVCPIAGAIILFGYLNNLPACP